MEAGAGHTEVIPYLREIVVFLVASVLIVPLFQWMRASPVLGYLAAGALIGPFGLAVIADTEGVARLAELGVVFLLFTIGLELPFERLLALRRLIFGLGGLQVHLWGCPRALCKHVGKFHRSLCGYWFRACPFLYCHCYPGVD